MTENMSGKKQAHRIQGTWDTMVKSESLRPEIAYRIEKLLHRMEPLADKIIFTTDKAHELLAECRHKPQAQQQQLDSGGDMVFVLLTHLEKTFEDLLRKTYAFRIKAG